MYDIWTISPFRIFSLLKFYTATAMAAPCPEPAPPGNHLFFQQITLDNLLLGKMARYLR